MALTKTQSYFYSCLIFIEKTMETSCDKTIVMDSSNTDMIKTIIKKW